MRYIPGPWEDDSGTITGKDGAHIAYVSDIDDFPCIDAEDMHPEQLEDVKAEYAGNSRLICAAPDMYEAIAAFLKNRDERANHQDPEIRLGLNVEILDGLQKALDKAEGKKG